MYLYACTVCILCLQCYREIQYHYVCTIILLAHRSKDGLLLCYNSNSRPVKLLHQTIHALCCFHIRWHHPTEQQCYTSHSKYITIPSGFVRLLCNCWSKNTWINCYYNFTMIMSERGFVPLKLVLVLLDQFTWQQGWSTFYTKAKVRYFSTYEDSKNIQYEV